MFALHDDSRRILKLSGDDPADFLQGLVTNDVGDIGARELRYAALLTPQGKYLFDFFVFSNDQDLLIDVPHDCADLLLQTLTRYRLRRKIEIVATNMVTGLIWGEGAVAPVARQDPRHSALGWRVYAADITALEGLLQPATSAETSDYHALCLTHGVPRTGTDLKANDTFILEAGFARLNGVDFRKGCYVGQEVTARMKHKTELRRGLYSVELDARADPGSEITREGRTVGSLGSVVGTAGLALLRHDRVDAAMMAGDARLTVQTRFEA